LLLAAGRSGQPRHSRDNLVDAFGGELGDLDVIDSLGYTPDTTLIKNKVVNEKVYATGRVDDLEEWVAENKPKVSLVEELANNRDLHVIGRDEPWRDYSLRNSDERAHLEQAMRTRFREEFS
jgi:hypothetical protein